MTDYSRYDDDFDKASEMSGSEIPDGKYECKFVEHRDGITQSGNERISLFMKIDRGPHKGQILFLDWVLTENRLPYIRGDMVKMGFDLKKDRFSHCVAMLDSYYGERFYITKKTKGDFANINLESRIESAVNVDWPNDEPRGDGEPTGDVPF